MATSVVSICNMALGWVGTRSIASMTENSPEARACSQFYEPARAQTLRDHAWNFAQARVALASLPVPAAYSEYAYAYAWPSDCLRALKVRNAAGMEEDFEVVLAPDGASRMILTNAASAVLVFTKDVEDPGVFDPLYVRALARRVAADIGKVFFKNNSQAVQELETYYLNEIRKAQTLDAGEGKPETVDESSWITARFR
jgi:hypothetical protein